MNDIVAFLSFNKLIKKLLIMVYSSSSITKSKKKALEKLKYLAEDFSLNSKVT